MTALAIPCPLGLSLAFAAQERRKGQTLFRGVSAALHLSLGPGLLLEGVQTRSQPATALRDKKSNSDRFWTPDVRDGLELTVLIGSSRSEAGAPSPREISDSHVVAGGGQGSPPRWG